MSIMQTLILAANHLNSDRTVFISFVFPRWTSIKTEHWIFTYYSDHEYFSNYPIGRYKGYKNIFIKRRKYKWVFFSARNQTLISDWLDLDWYIVLAFINITRMTNHCDKYKTAIMPSHAKKKTTLGV